MSRKMYVTDDMGLDDALVTIADRSVNVALMWPWFVPAFDDWGRMEANARRIKGKLFPNFDGITAKDVEAAILSFAAEGLVTLYDVDGVRYMAVSLEKWFTYQTHIPKSKRDSIDSKYPAPPSNELKIAVIETTSSENARDCAQNSASPSLLLSSPHLLYGAAEDGAPPKEKKLSGKEQFVPPAVEVVEAYFVDKGYPGHGQEFWDHHQARGWYMSNKRRMVDWKAAVRTWIGNIPKFGGGGYGGSSGGVTRPPHPQGPIEPRYASKPPPPPRMTLPGVDRT